MSTKIPAAGALPRIAGRETLVATVWRQFRRHPAAIFSLVTLGIIVAASVFAFLSPHDPNSINLANRWASPSLAHPFGTDKLGRDTLTRILYGGRVSLTVGVLAMMAAVLVGTVVGGIAGFFRGIVDSILMRITDVFLIFPAVFVALFVSTLLRQANISLLSGGLGNVILVITLTSWMVVARLVRASFLKITQTQYIEAARSYGTSKWRLITHHILPNALGPIIVAGTRGVAEAILLEAGLSFLGLGIQPPAASWGNILQDAFTSMGLYPWFTVFPGLMIFITVLSLNYLGDALRDALDPYKVVGQKLA